MGLVLGAHVPHARATQERQDFRAGSPGRPLLAWQSRARRLRAVQHTQKTRGFWHFYTSRRHYKRPPPARCGRKGGAPAPLGDGAADSAAQGRACSAREAVRVRKEGVWMTAHRRTALRALHAALRRRVGSTVT